jgi:hypothetical protein
LSISEPETKDLLPNSKGILENFNPIDRCGAPKICLASTCHLDLDMMQSSVVAEPNFRSGTLCLWKLMLNALQNVAATAAASDVIICPQLQLL